MVASLKRKKFQIFRCLKFEVLVLAYYLNYFQAAEQELPNITNSTELQVDLTGGLELNL